MMSPVRISYIDLVSRPDSLEQEISKAFGSERHCLGFILIDDLPLEFSQLRYRLLILAERFSILPQIERENLARPETSYLFGWSHGKEIMNGRPDLQKGSFYANPIIDHPDVSNALRATHPEYYAGNVWPKDIEGLEDFEEAFKAFGKLVYEVGLALAKACERFVAPSVPGGQTVESLIASSRCNKARLLHYYPESTSSNNTTIETDALCGTHIDHSLLTGLCSAMYLDHSDPKSPPKIVSAPSSTAGLHIYSRRTVSENKEGSNQAIKVDIPPDCLAFQTGEALSILTGGRLAATPHFVSGSGGGGNTSSSISRETFALFLQPDVDDIIGQDGETFGAFTKRVLGRHYADLSTQEAES